jgi:hypothetical protein
MAALTLLTTASNVVAGPGLAESGPGHLLWKLGVIDGSDTEFALAPGIYKSYQNDGFFALGRTDPKRDWPYVHPGPDDAWAGSRHHIFTIVFGAKGRPTDTGACSLEIALVDAQSRVPPELKIDLNGTERRLRLTPGGSDASISGRLDQVKRPHVQIPFPTGAIKEGTNVLTITTLSGSWLLYDGLEFRAPQGI